jgi:hypothetical protein
MCGSGTVGHHQRDVHRCQRCFKGESFVAPTRRSPTGGSSTPIASGARRCPGSCRGDVWWIQIGEKIAISTMAPLALGGFAESSTERRRCADAALPGARATDFRAIRHGPGTNLIVPSLWAPEAAHREALPDVGLDVRMIRRGRH